MAKLSANGRELARVKKVTYTPGSQDTVKREETYVLMSNKRILKKLVVWMIPSAFSDSDKPKRIDHGWKRAQLAGVRSKIPSNEEVERWVLLMERNGYVREAVKN